MRFDELNILGIEEYFNIPTMPKKARKKRMDLAYDLLEDVAWVLAICGLWKDRGKRPGAEVAEDFRQRLMETVAGHVEVDEEVTDYIGRFASQAIETTAAHMDADESYLSGARARFIAENEGNRYINDSEHKGALASGMARKRWITMRDEKVRATHWEVDGMAIPIKDYFIVGDSLMRYPGDLNGAPEEVINCRCHLQYT